MYGSKSHGENQGKKAQKEDMKSAFVIFNWVVKYTSWKGGILEMAESDWEWRNWKIYLSK